MTTTGYGDICPESNEERGLAIFAMMVGGAFYGYVVANISSIVTQADANEQAHYGRMKTVHAYMHLKGFPRGLRHRVHRYFVTSNVSSRSGRRSTSVPSSTT